ncbi:DUF3558 domain-containing protein [Saccharopolyspora sp. HNM0983]|uniref:DUF3558 domain-containing protein n=1 Tax=Saccharopolyspora montiporae TaxID=2781240 RepID=A0A929G211_9PSEU|nr:DUF3558 domain-containing protein [Saccharopolyspora sp. HNM0983]MBE9376402.1 DUF3558 domain-containing protein [Saccharopolyspora sp. HNM0983]
MASSRTGVARLTAAVAAAAGLVGCGAPQSADSSATGTPATPPPTSSAQPPPPRPAELSLHDVDPCSLLDDGQRAQLGFDRRPIADSDAGFGDAATCSHRNTTAKIGTRLALITTESIGVWTGDTAQVEAEPQVIGGFPSLVIKTPGLDLSCNVAVDVAEGQHLDVLYRDDGGRPAPPLDQLCAGAQRVAEEAVAGLSAAHPELGPDGATGP